MAKKVVKKTKPKVKPEAKSRELARPGDPYVGPDQTPIPPEPLSRTPVPDVNATIDPETFKPMSRRTMKDMSAAPMQLNAIACIFMYTMVGISDREIASTLNISISEVKQVRAIPAYAECFNMVVGEFINANSDHIQSRIAAYGHGALSQVAHTAFYAQKESLKYRASETLLAMGGHAKNNKNGDRSDAMNELRIVVMENDGSVNVNVNTGV